MENSMIRKEVAQCLNSHPLSPLEIDCVTSIMLKILDRKCKMDQNEKDIFQILYDLIKNQPGQLLQMELRDMISTALAGSNEQIRMQIYEKRVLAETIISRPVMKAFKAKIREQLFSSLLL